MNSAFRFPLYRDELARQGLYKQHKVKGDRIQQLKWQIPVTIGIIDLLASDRLIE